MQNQRRVVRIDDAVVVGVGLVHARGRGTSNCATWSAAVSCSSAAPEGPLRAGTGARAADSDVRRTLSKRLWGLQGDRSQLRRVRQIVASLLGSGSGGSSDSPRRCAVALAYATRLVAAGPTRPAGVFGFCTLAERTPLLASPRHKMITSGTVIKPKHTAGSRTIDRTIASFRNTPHHLDQETLGGRKNCVSCIEWIAEVSDVAASLLGTSEDSCPGTPF